MDEAVFVCANMSRYTFTRGFIMETQPSPASGIVVVREMPHLDHATKFASLGFRVEETPHLREDVMNHLEDGDVYTIFHARKPCGFAIVRRFPGRVLYLCGVMLTPKMQGKGYATTIIEAVRTPEDAFLALRTQSPLMWAAGRRICKGAWLPQGSNTDAELVEIGQDVAARIHTTFPVHPGFYDSALYGTQPVHRDEKIQTWWNSLCDFARGDAVVCVGRL